MDDYIHHDDKTYAIHFCPAMVLKAGVYQFEEHLFLEFGHIREFLDLCIAAYSSPKPVPDQLTVDKWALVSVFELLKNKSTSDFQDKVCDRILLDLKQVIKDTTPLISKRFPWSFLPPGKSGIDRVISHFNQLKILRPDVHIDEERLRFISSFNPDEAYLGRDSFDGYVAFYFAKPRIAALECAIYGNALYIITQDWLKLSRLSRHDLNSSFQNCTYRIVHDASFQESVTNQFCKFGITTKLKQTEKLLNLKFD